MVPLSARERHGRLARVRRLLRHGDGGPVAAVTSTEPLPASMITVVTRPSIVNVLAAG